MKNANKLKAMFRIIGIIALAAVIWFSMAACKDDDGKGGGSGKKSIVAEASDSGTLYINYEGGDSEWMNVTVTTDLPAPNDSFTMTKTSNTKTISGLSANQKVKITISFPGSYANMNDYGNGNVGFQTYKK